MNETRGLLEDVEGGIDDANDWISGNGGGHKSDDSSVDILKAIKDAINSTKDEIEDLEDDIEKVPEIIMDQTKILLDSIRSMMDISIATDVIDILEKLLKSTVRLIESFSKLLLWFYRFMLASEPAIKHLMRQLPLLLLVFFTSVVEGFINFL